MCITWPPTSPHPTPARCRPKCCRSSAPIAGCEISGIERVRAAHYAWLSIPTLAIVLILFGHLRLGNRFRSDVGQCTASRKSLDGWPLLLCCWPLVFRLRPSPRVSAPLRMKITLHRKLPPTAHLNGTGIEVQVISHNIQGDVASDLKSMLETELIKDDRRLRSEDKHPDSIVVCTITEYAQPMAQSSTRSTYVPGSKKPQSETVTRYTGILKVAYQAKDAHSGRTLDSENITAKYDDEFNQNGSTSGGVTGTLSHTWDKLKHGKLEGDKPPTAGELRDVLLSNVVSQIASRLVN